MSKPDCKNKRITLPNETITAKVCLVQYAQVGGKVPLFHLSSLLSELIVRSLCYCYSNSAVFEVNQICTVCSWFLQLL